MTSAVDTPVPLEDLEDAVAWVKWQVSRFAASGSYTAAEHDEMVNQGLLVLYEVHEKWDPAKSPKFSAYAISIFKRRMIDWYRRELTSSGRGHVPQAPGGKRLAPVYHGMVSLNAHADSHGHSGPGAMNETFSQDRALTHYDPVE